MEIDTNLVVLDVTAAWSIEAVARARAGAARPCVPPAHGRVTPAHPRYDVTAPAF